MGSIIEDKGGDHYAYKIDEFANNLLINILEKNRLDCFLFSEEGGWSQIGTNPRFFVICDPYCNTSLTMRSFRESAVSICITDLNGVLVSCAIADLQVERVFYADTTGSYLGELKEASWIKSSLQVSGVRNLADSFVVMSLLKKNRRPISASSGVFLKAKTIHGVDGAIMIGRLAAGNIDAYLDPFVGQPLYEVPCFEIIIRAGGIVTDINKTPFNLSDIISKLNENPKGRYKFVASCNEFLHCEILENLRVM